MFFVVERMKKTFVCLSSLAVISAPCASAQKAEAGLSIGFHSDFSLQKEEFGFGTAKGPVSLAQARPGQPFSSTSVAANTTPIQLNDHKDWHLSDRAEQFNTGTAFVIGDNDDISNRLLISPRVSQVRTSDAALKSYSAEIRLGNVVQFDRNSANRGWYVFAATDGEALSINTRSLAPGDGNPMAVSLSDQITIGDLQAGVSTYVGKTQLTISYIQTEAKYSAQGSETVSKTESFAGISLAKSF